MLHEGGAAMRQVQRRWCRISSLTTSAIKVNFAEWKTIERKHSLYSKRHQDGGTRRDLRQLEPTDGKLGATPIVGLRTKFYTPEDEWKIENREQRISERVYKTRMRMLEHSAGYAAIKEAKALEKHQNRLRHMLMVSRGMQAARTKLQNRPKVEGYVQQKVRDHTSYAYHKHLEQQMPEFFQKSEAANTVPDFLDKTALRTTRMFRLTDGLGKDGARTQRGAEFQMTANTLQSKYHQMNEDKLRRPRVKYHKKRWY